MFWLLYVALHFAFNVNVPYAPSEFALNNAVKSYFVVSAPLVMLLLFIKSPVSLIVRRDFFWTTALLCLFALSCNVAIRLYELSGHLFYIPHLNALADLYILRTLGPLAVTTGLVGLTSPGGTRSLTRIAVFSALVVGGVVGSVISGGRASVTIAFLSICAVFVIKRQIVAVFVVAVIGIIGAAIANLSADYINNRANLYVQRSLQWVLIHKKGEAIVSIESSTDWRRELITRALDEWRSDSRIFWTGRATYGFGVADEQAIFVAGGWEAVMQSALRRGVTHNLISDLLVTYGLIGMILYFVLLLAIARFLWSLYRHRSALSTAASNLVLVTMISSASWFVSSVLGGNYYPTELIWFIVILMGGFHSRVALTEGVRRTAAPLAGPARQYVGVRA